MKIRIAIFGLTLLGLAVTAIGAVITAHAVILNEQQAVEIGAPRWSG
jgi:hypothetical protein